MAYIAGLLLVDAPASALNMAGQVEGARTANLIGIKQIRTRQGIFPYVSAQAFRNWLRTSLENCPELGWKASPVLREAKTAYTDANPIDYWDDDLFGYMRAPGARADQKAVRDRLLAQTPMTETRTEITRISPFRMGTLVSIAPVAPTDDFGTMSRHEGDPVPHEHQFYRAVLKGMFSLDLASAGTFTYRSKAGYLNLDEVRVEKAQEGRLEHLKGKKAYRLPMAERVRRVAALLRGLATITGGAKLALHYTDVTPVVVVAAVVKGGNNPFQYIIGADNRGLPQVNEEAFRETMLVWGDQVLSKLYVGWSKGFHDTQREALSRLLAEILDVDGSRGYVLSHPREALEVLTSDLEKDGPESGWME